MSKRELQELDFEIDKLTSSIENSLTGEIFETTINRLTAKEIRQISKTDWLFDWHREIKDASKEIYKLTTAENQNIIQGLICLGDNHDHIFMHLIESAKFNRGENKLYKGVAANLVAFACKISFEKGYGGVVAFVAKTQLIEHYKFTLGAKQFAGNKMYLESKEALALVKQYFKEAGL